MLFVYNNHIDYVIRLKPREHYDYSLGLILIGAYNVELYGQTPVVCTVHIISRFLPKHVYFFYFL